MKGRSTQSQRVKALELALAEALEALWDIGGVCEILRADATINAADFPNEIASVIRMIDYRANTVAAKLEVVP